MAYFVKYRDYSTIRNGLSCHFVTVIADTAADIPEPQENWETGSELIVVENGGKKYILTNARTWVEVPNFTSAANSTPQNVEWVDELPSETFSGFISSTPSDTYNLSKYIEEIKIPEGVTAIAEGCFATHYPVLESVVIPGSVQTIGSGAFNGCTALTSVQMSNGLKQINGGAFTGCTNLSSIDIPETVEVIQSTFISGTAIESITFKSTALELQNGCLAGAAVLKKVYFKKTNAKLAENEYSLANDAITDIYVPWSEGEVANAPWGATNATIHYNYTG